MCFFCIIRHIGQIAHIIYIKKNKQLYKTGDIRVINRKMNNDKKKNDCGFSLIEIIFSPFENSSPTWRFFTSINVLFFIFTLCSGVQDNLFPVSVYKSINLFASETLTP